MLLTQILKSLLALHALPDQVPVCVSPLSSVTLRAFNDKHVSMDAQSPIILVVGGAGVGKKALIARIVRSGSTGSPSLPFSWKIDTKYYIAEARFDAARYSAAEETQQAEALILTVDATDQQGYEAAKAWHADRSHVECEVCLMVVNKMDLLSGSDGSLQRSAWHQDAQDWCCENYFEYIEVSMHSTRIQLLKRASLHCDR